MQQTVTFYLEQAAQCGRDADASTLPHQRERFLRSQAAWQKLADQRATTQAERLRIETEKAARA
ncbi:hypothetical protein OKA06_06715 [Novosphingobium sp. MW5]|nr:hypothetical protein [Novosphingobium sp. MW5]